MRQYRGHRSHNEVFVVLLFILPLSVFGQSTECSKALDGVRLMCESAQNACKDLTDCLVRRDTCVESLPNSSEKCEQLDLCMQNFKSGFSDQSKCEYTWVIPTSDKAFCRVKKHFLFSEEGCPGRINGFLNALAYGLSGAVDNKFNCASVLDKRNSHAKERLAKLKRYVLKTYLRILIILRI